MNAFSVRSSILSRLLFLVLLFFAFSFWFQKLGNFDFWWHIKTGQYIIEHRALPDKDPFTYTFLEHDKDAPEMPAVVLKSYWLSQIIFFLIYQRFGPPGIILFKSSVFALMLTFLWKYMRDRSVSMALTFIMLTGFIIFAKEFIAERPQIFSFLFAAIVFYMLEGVREAYSVQRIASSKEGETINSTRYPLHAICYFLLPLIMLLWANMHRGYMVGMVFILVYAFSLLLRRTPGDSRLLPIAVYLVSLFVTLLNPVTYHPITSFISSEMSGYQNEALEFNPVFKVLPFLNRNWTPFFLMLVLAAVIIAASLISTLRPVGRQGSESSVITPSSYLKRGRSGRALSFLPFEHLILLIGTAVASLSSMRYSMFFMIVAVPIVTVYLSRRFGSDSHKPSAVITPPSPPLNLRGGLEGLRRRMKSYETLTVIILSIILLVLSLRSPLFTQSRKDLIDSSVLPVRAVEFLKEKSLPPNIFNDINWGGYMMWELYPKYQVFSDTRALNLEIYRQYLSILHANETMHLGVPEWKALLDMYGINTIIHSTVNPYSGEVWPLMSKLFKDPEWHLVYIDGITAILVRNAQPGLPELPKSELLKQVRLEASKEDRQ